MCGFGIHLISTHALREEGDFYKSIRFCKIFYFYPRPPRGGRPGANGWTTINQISTHALREEGDSGW